MGLAASASSNPTIPDGLNADQMNYDIVGRVGVTINAHESTSPRFAPSARGRMSPGSTRVWTSSMPLRLPANWRISAHWRTRACSSARAMAKPISATGSVDSQGDAVLETDRVRAVNGLTGSGVTVGVLSDSFNVLGGYSTDVATGDLPNNVDILQEGPAGSTDEGRAMAQIIYDERRA